MGHSRQYYVLKAHIMAIQGPSSGRYVRYREPAQNHDMRMGAWLVYNSTFTHVVNGLKS
jgi:hypothetical protein